MLRSRRPLVAAAALSLLALCVLAVLRARPVPYLSEAGGALLLDDGVPEMQVAPVVACPPVLVQGVLRGRGTPPPGTRGALATVYVITPTYPRAVQVPEMTRLAQTLMLTTNVFWVVTEDATERTPAVTEILRASGLPHVHIIGLKPDKYSKEKGFTGQVPRGVSNRMAALQWLRQNAEHGVFYFADDDNTYDYRLFAELARTRRASAFPVGLVTQAGLSTPVVRDGAVVDFYDGWIGGRTFPMDMAGFAVSVKLLLEHPDAAMPFTAGYEEDGFLKSLGLKKEDLEPLAENCTKVLVWHTQTKQPHVPFHEVDVNKYRGTNMEVLRRIVNPSCCPADRTIPPPAPPSSAARAVRRSATLPASSSSVSARQTTAARNVTASPLPRPTTRNATAARSTVPPQAENATASANATAGAATAQLPYGDVEKSVLNLGNGTAKRRVPVAAKGASARGRYGLRGGSAAAAPRAGHPRVAVPPPSPRRAIGLRRPVSVPPRTFTRPSPRAPAQSRSNSQRASRLWSKYSQSKYGQLQAIRSGGRKPSQTLKSPRVQSQNPLALLGSEAPQTPSSSGSPISPSGSNVSHAQATTPPQSPLFSDQPSVLLSQSSPSLSSIAPQSPSSQTFSPQSQYTASPSETPLPPSPSPISLAPGGVSDPSVPHAAGAGPTPPPRPAEHAEGGGGGPG